jgi:hypothetical protein
MLGNTAAEPAVAAQAARPRENTAVGASILYSGITLSD